MCYSCLVASMQQCSCTSVFLFLIFYKNNKTTAHFCLLVFEIVEFENIIILAAKFIMHYSLNSALVLLYIIVVLLHK